MTVQYSNRIGCVGGGHKVAYGTFDGVYFQDLREPNREPIKVLALTDVAQVDVLDEYGLLIVLSGESSATVAWLLGAYLFFFFFFKRAKSLRSPLTHLKRWTPWLG